uniref:Phosphatidylinositol glycan anchor biosynthesis class S n=1 Tax=Leptobrachium leishanense TaxID=445787 RepID=A0A8C5MUZ8_9ANUR
MAAPVKPSLAAVEVTRGKRAAISIALISAVLGLPLWWKTTETYRAALPYSEISQLDTLQLQLTVPVEIIFTKGTLSVEQQRKLPSSGSKDKEVLLNSHTGFNCHYVIKYRIASIGEEETLALPTFKDADEALQQLDKGDLGSVSLYILAETSALFTEGIHVYIGKYRRAFVKYAVDQTDRIENVLRTLNTKVQSVIQTMSFNEKAVTAALSDRIPITHFNIEDLENIRRAFKSSPGYDLTFSLLNPDPKSLDLNWNISSASEQYIQPFLDKLSPVANFSVDSQILFYAVLGVTPRFEKSTSSYILNANNLPHVINPVEARLGSSAASLYPVLNFLLYVPEYFHSPLHIQDKDGKRVPTNAFHSPRWGGIMVYNVDYNGQEDQEFPIHIDINMVQVMEVFLTQLRLLMGISKVYVPDKYVLENPGTDGLTDWELDKLLWSRTVENIVTVTTTLTSLAQLLDQIGNIVINDNVASEVYHAVSSIQIALSELDAGRLEYAFQASKTAISSSEKAFFDPSLLHLLYFPDDQKFAIYIPLFLPMAVPIILSLLKIFKESRSKKEANKIE